MRMHEMPGFLSALRKARMERSDLPTEAWRRAARTNQPVFRTLRVCPSLIIRWAEWYALGLQGAA